MKGYKNPFDSFDVEILLRELLGKRSTHGLASPLEDKKEFRRHYKKVILQLEKYLDVNLNTDRDHKNQIALIRQGIRAAISVPKFELQLVVYLTRLCLALLGEQPDHSEKSVVNRPECFRLNSHRTLFYAVSPEQKARLIYDRKIRRDGHPKNPKEVETWRNRYAELCKVGKFSQFLEEFREADQPGYCDLFC